MKVVVLDVVWMSDSFVVWDDGDVGWQGERMAACVRVVRAKRIGKEIFDEGILTDRTERS
jgi:hypothetical protein